MEAVANYADWSEDRSGVKPAFIGSIEMPADAIIFHQEDIVKQERENLDEKNYGCFYLCPSLDFPDVFHARKSQCGQKFSYQLQ